MRFITACSTVCGLALSKLSDYNLNSTDEKPVSLITTYTYDSAYGEYKGYDNKYDEIYKAYDSGTYEYYNGAYYYVKEAGYYGTLYTYYTHWGTNNY